MSEKTAEVGMGGKVQITYDGATMTIAPITLSFAEKLVAHLGGCELNSTFGVEANSVAAAPGDELGCLRFDLDNALTVSFNVLNQLFGLSLPVVVGASQHVSIGKYLLVLLVLECIPKPEHSYCLNLHVEPPSVLCL